MTEEELQQMNKLLLDVKARLDRIDRIDRFVFLKDIQIDKDIGIRIGTDIKQKLAFYGVTPVVRYDGLAFNADAGGTYGANEQAMLTGLKNALLSYGLIHT